MRVIPGLMCLLLLAGPRLVSGQPFVLHGSAGPTLIDSGCDDERDDHCEAQELHLPPLRQSQPESDSHETNNGGRSLSDNGVCPVTAT